MHFLLSAVLLIPGVAAPQAEPAPVDLVRPFVGTENFGNTFPGAAAPFGMVQVSPDTGGQGGYDYKQSTIYGFSQTHLSGVGCGVAGELPIMPTTGAITSVDPNVYRSAYSHDDEEASPGHYRVGLSTYGIDAELTATERTGWQRYTFPATGAANVLFNTGKANQSVFDSEIHVVDDRTIEGRVEAGNFCAGQDDHTVYFTASFDRPFSAYGTWRGSTVTAGSRDAAGAGSNGAYVTFDATADRDVVVKVGLSYTGVAGARANLAAETKDYDFTAVRDALRAKWVSTLGKVKIGGGTGERRAAFYTALYHSLLHPNLAGDVDGSYVGFDRAVHKAEGYTPYQNFSLWDTYRPQNQLLELLTPEVARDVALSVLAIGRDGGWLPRWALVNSETNIMTGDPVTPFLVEAWSKGLLKGHEQIAYALLRANALSEPPAGSPYNGRTGIKYYSDRGYIPSGLKLGADCVHKGGDNDCVHPASATLEYSAADASLALMAEGLGKTADARLFAARGQWYRNLWDSSAKQFRPRAIDGTWLTPYDPVAAAQQFHEGGAYQYQWLAPQDPAGLVGLMGGRRATEKRLDDFFAYGKLLKDPAGTARTDWIAAPYDYYAKATYNPNNEPDLLAPYMYHWAGAPAKTATVVRAAMTLFTTGPDGMTGNDDLGTMSAWYVFSSLGLYPTMSGANFLAVSSPQFPSATVSLARGRTLTITAPGASDQKRYIQRVRVNGSSLTRNWVPWSAVGSGGTIEHTLGATPSAWGTSVAAEPPSVNQAPLDNRTHLSAAVRPATAAVPPGGSATLTVDIVGQAPGALKPRVTATAPAGFQVAVRQPGTIVSKHLPTSATATVTVTAPAGVALGSYPLTVDVSGVKKTADLVVTTPSTCASSISGQCAVVLSPTRDGTATVAASDQGNFDGVGWSYDAALLPAAGPVTWDGVTYNAPDPTGTAANFTAATGRTLLVPPGSHTSANLVLTSHNGPVGSSVTIGYTDGTYASTPVTIADWCGSAAGTTAVLSMPHRIKAGQGVDGPPVSLFGVRLPVAEGKQIRSITLPDDARVYVYALTLA
ncbi:GH92 family glycosyl hydrolase [Paractinoplanes brasiliensis]|uniref:Putative alpha-1,2-mannosidase n=1 Tax=Paractinoplanes brasiliensis TaxID=52695 RepID=A0A4R6K0F8_9ACTN|nr:GH92 family glycosyl hydrolase [Actinoplanes brasiliensis]TDO41066.1 putative alpha-1,2-mannosidase [Actinoplanes brasiliensis]GID26137.1 alpha-1,2-mannosidase [Actinoplanes brasiliensis]